MRDAAGRSVITGRFDHGQEQAQRSARASLEIIEANLKHLRRADKYGRLEKTYNDFKAIAASNQKFTPRQLSLIDGIYERTMKGAGFGACDAKHDFNKKRY